MKKLLGILGASIMTASSAGSVMACYEGEKPYHVVPATITAARFTADTKIDVLMNKSMDNQKMINSDFIVSSEDGSVLDADYSIKTSDIDDANDSLVHLTINAGYSRERLLLSYRECNKVEITPLAPLALIQSASFENDTKIDVRMSKPVKTEQVKIQDFKIVAANSLSLNDEAYAVTKVMIDTNNDALVYLTIAAGHSTETNLYVSYKEQKKVLISSIETPAVADEAKFLDDTSIQVMMNKPVETSDFKLSDFVFSGGDNKIKASAAVVDTKDRAAIDLTVSAGYSLRDDMKINYKSAASWIIVSQAPLNPVSAGFSNETMIDVVMNREIDKVKPSDFVMMNKDGTLSNVSVYDAVIDGKNSSLVHLTVADGHARETNIKLVYNPLDNIKNQGVIVAVIPPSSPKSAIFVSKKTINVTMNWRVIATDFTAQDFVVKTSKNEIIKAISAVIDSANSRLVRVTIANDQHFADSDSQLIYKNTKSPVIISPEASAGAVSAWFESDTTIAVYMNRDVLAEEVKPDRFTVQNSKTHETYNVSGSEVPAATPGIVKLTIEKVDSTSPDIKVEFNGIWIKIVQNIPLKTLTAKYVDRYKIEVEMSIPVRYPSEIVPKDFKYVSGDEYIYFADTAEVSSTEPNKVTIVVMGGDYWDSNAGLIWRGQQPIHVEAWE